jgi:hypothetical protein
MALSAAHSMLAGHSPLVQGTMQALPAATSVHCGGFFAPGSIGQSLSFVHGGAHAAPVLSKEHTAPATAQGFLLLQLP